MAQITVTELNREFLERFSPELYKQIPEWATHKVMGSDAQKGQPELARYVAQNCAADPHDCFKAITMKGHELNIPGAMSRATFHIFFITVAER